MEELPKRRAETLPAKHRIQTTQGTGPCIQYVSQLTYSHLILLQYGSAKNAKPGL